MEQAGRFVIVTLPAVHEPEVGKHAGLVFLVAEVAEDVPGFLEVLNRFVLGPSVGEREAEVVEGHRLGVRVAQVADDRERREVLLGRLLGLAVTPELHAPAMIQSPDGVASRFPRSLVRVEAPDGRVGRGWLEFNFPVGVNRVDDTRSG